MNPMHHRDTEATENTERIDAEFSEDPQKGILCGLCELGVSVVKRR